MELPLTAFIEEPEDIPFSIPTFTGAEVNTTGLEDMYKEIWDDGRLASLSKFMKPKREKEEELLSFMTYWEKGKERATEQLPDRIYVNNLKAAVEDEGKVEISPSMEAWELRRRMAQPGELSEGQCILRLLGQGTLASDKPKPLEKMPSRSSDKAPKFSGKTADLVHYLEEIHHLCKKAGCTDEYEWPKWAIWYLDNDTANLWTQLVEETTGRWDRFVESRKIIAMEEDLREYLQQYETIAGYLNRCYKLTQEDYDSYFWEGLDQELQKDMLENLKFRNGLRDSDDPWPMNKVLQEIKELLRHGVKFNDGTRVPRTDEPMYQLIDEWMARDRRRREEQQAPIIQIEHEEDPPTNMNMFVAVHNAFQYIERARIKEYVSDGEDTAEEVISETEYEARRAGTEQVFSAARREENKQQRKTPKFDGVVVPGKER
ncbi:hypothetical protein M404DRAFT_24491 [Pisolithus tinctorius Marx 270]|uniref:Uncharacterized protein n=1 Tax=Pisolithus tinctorius Marx 270 TaxID=870435 RepID=A0A0C3JCJ4_PISTI|nr:hypothetical protein M404DRAFT_24491 [Pisolithus tinctorius Marx 270]